MERVEYIKPDFPADAFAGTASYYIRYRVPYPAKLLRCLVDRSGVKGKGCLLDLACGPGRLAIDLAPCFGEVWAVDLEAEMIAKGREEAARRGVDNIKWSVGRAEDLVAPVAFFDLITVGEAFHRLDQQVVATKSLQWLRPGGCLALLGCYTILSASEPWQKVVVETVRKWTGRGSPSGASAEKPKPGNGPEHNERVLRQEGFTDVSRHSFLEPREWTADSVIGYLYSTSVASRKVLGESAGKFESELRAALRAHDPSGTYRENASWGFTIGRKP